MILYCFFLPCLVRSSDRDRLFCYPFSIVARWIFQFYLMKSISTEFKVVQRTNVTSFDELYKPVTDFNNKSQSIQYNIYIVLYAYPSLLWYRGCQLRTGYRSIIFPLMLFGLSLSLLVIFLSCRHVGDYLRDFLLLFVYRRKDIYIYIVVIGRL